MAVDRLTWDLRPFWDPAEKRIMMQRQGWVVIGCIYAFFIGCVVFVILFVR